MELTLQDLEIKGLKFKVINFVDHEPKYEYIDGKKTDNIVGSRVKLLGLNTEGKRKYFTVATEEILEEDSIPFGVKVQIVEPTPSAWFDRSTNSLKISVKAKTVKAI